MKYNQESIKSDYDNNLWAARKMLANLPAAEGREPTTGVLSGWIFEQTVRKCLSEELEGLDVSPTMQEQQIIGGRKKVDLLINGKVAIEIKAKGVFGKSTEQKYVKCRDRVKEKGWRYFYLTLGESYSKYRDLMKKVFGTEKSFFLDTKEGNDWERFVTEIEKNLK